MSAHSAERGDGGASPSSSPRFPSPPPAVEVQFGPQSPSVSGAVSEFSLDKTPDEGASRRIRPGTTASEMSKGPPFIPLHQLESPFQLQEYLKSLYIKLTCDESSTVKPVNKEMATELATPPTQQDSGEVVDRNLWLYELCRFLCSKTGRLIGAFFADNPPCSSHTCPEMRASEWQYLCAVHEPPKSCCAIDYCCHTLDWASNILTSPKHFPSRLALGGEGVNAYQSMRQLTNIFRRVYRIYAHAWFQHREVFWTIEAEMGLYMFFKTVCDQYQLIPEDNYTIPPEAEGIPEEREDIPTVGASPEKENHISILRKNETAPESEESDQSMSAVATGATTRRHKHTPSTGVPVTVIAEGQEDEEEEEETTMIDLGGPGPAQDSSLSLSPPKPRTDRVKSPGFIDIPQNIDPERAPEDPTPIATQGSNPFGSPGPSEELDEDQSRVKEETEATVSHSSEAQESEAKVATNADNEHVSSSISETESEPQASTKPLSNSGELGVTDSHNSDTETQIAIEDTNKNDDNEDRENEKMEKIDFETLKDEAKAKPVETTKAEESTKES